ncbi:MAG: class I SAM-dependent methyltransferase [Actinomycetota bacterium]|nr:class I SAM-dependent methyltransferase [Actinomycetota bacterium]
MLTARYDVLGVHPGDAVLDLGCGFGRHAFEAARRGARVVALDAGRDEVLAVRATFAAMRDAGELPASTFAAAVQGDALALPFADGAFDRVICSEVLEHIPNDVGAMAELARVLRPGGTMAVTVPRRGPERINWALSTEYHEVPGGHIRIYSRRVLEERLTSVGLRVRSHHYAHALHSPYWWLKCLVGTTNDTNFMVRQYHRLLVWDIMKHPALTTRLEASLNPLVGKSLVVYLEKSAA